MTIADKVKAAWVYVQDLLDVRGDTVMLAMSSVFIARVALAAFGKPAINASEAALYASAIGSFAWSNRGPKS